MAQCPAENKTFSHFPSAGFTYCTIEPEPLIVTVRFVAYLAVNIRPVKYLDRGGPFHPGIPLFPVIIEDIDFLTLAVKANRLISGGK